MRRAKSMYVYDDVKTQKLQVRGTPCTCCSRSKQRSSPGLRLRLTPRLVLIAHVYGEDHILSSLLLLLIILRSIWQSTSHTPVVEKRQLWVRPFYKKKTLEELLQDTARKYGCEYCLTNIARACNFFYHRCVKCALSYIIKSRRRSDERMRYSPYTFYQD